MAMRDPNKTAKNKMIENMSAQLERLRPLVLAETKISSVSSLHGKYGGKFVDYMNTRTDVIRSPDEFISKYLHGLQQKARFSDSANRNLELLKRSEYLRQYLRIFLARVYYRQSDALGRIRPDNDGQARIWFGQEKQNYGLFITPRFNRTEKQWENDGSEIKFFPKLYWTIGHVLYTGLMIPGKDECITFSDVDQYLTFFLNVLVRASGSKYEYDLARLYCDYVRRSDTPENVPLLIPEFRYGGLEKKHRYRLDFTLINPYNLQRFGFELSPWSTHGQMEKLKGLSQKEINDLAKENFEREMSKHKDFFRRHNISVLIYTDSDLENIDDIFNRDIVPLLESKDLFCPPDFDIISHMLG